MPNTSFRCKAFLVLLLTILAAPWASAAEGPAADRPVEAAASPLEFFDRVWIFLKNTWSETGCHIDPDGRCLPAPQPQTDEGCRIDPDGRCST